jgi:hypothetical protein
MDLFDYIDIFAIFAVPYPERPDYPIDSEEGKGPVNNTICLIA